MNNRGEKLFSIWWFINLALVGMVAIAGVFLFFNKEVNTMNFESTLIYNNIVSCVVENGFINLSLINDSSFFKKCNINENLFNLNGQYYLSINFSSDSSSISESKGNPQLKQDCLRDEKNVQKIQAKSYPSCFSSNENVYYYDNGIVKSGQLYVFVGTSENGGIAKQ